MDSIVRKEFTLHSVLLFASENIAAGLGDYALEEKLCFQNPVDDCILSLHSLSSSFKDQMLTGNLFCAQHQGYSCIHFFFRH